MQHPAFSVMYNYILGPSEGIGTWEVVPTIIFADWLTLLQPKGLIKIYVSLAHYSFLVLVTFCNEVIKTLRNLCLHFARQDGQDRKKWKESHATKVNKIPKTKRRKYGMNIRINFGHFFCSFLEELTPEKVSFEIN